MHAQEFAQQENFKLMTTYPKKIFTSEDYDRPLEALGNCFKQILSLTLKDYIISFMLFEKA